MESNKNSKFLNIYMNDIELHISNLDKLFEKFHEMSPKHQNQDQLSFQQYNKGKKGTSDVNDMKVLNTKKNQFENKEDVKIFGEKEKNSINLDQNQSIEFKGEVRPLNEKEKAQTSDITCPFCNQNIDKKL